MKILWSALLHRATITNRQTNRQTDRQTDTTKIMVTWPWTKNCLTIGCWKLFHDQLYSTNVTETRD